MKRVLTILMCSYFAAFAVGLPLALHLHLEEHADDHEGCSEHPSHDCATCPVCQTFLVTVKAELPRIFSVVVIEPGGWFWIIEPTGCLPHRPSLPLPVAPRAPPAILT